MEPTYGVSHRSRRVGLGVMLASVAGLAASFAVGGLVIGGGVAGAQAKAQSACASENLTITPPSGGGASSYVPLGPSLSVTVKKPTDAFVILSLDGNVSSATSSEMRASWSVDGATPTDFEYGPGNIHENTGAFDGTNTVLDLIPLGKGTHSIQPEVRMNGAAGTSGIVSGSCAIVDVLTS
jgi:hypothetical protein